MCSEYKPHPLRIQRKRTKGAKLPKGAVVCTRPGPYGNPFVGPEAIAAFRRWAILLMTGEEITASNVWTMRKGERRGVGVPNRSPDLCDVAGSQFNAQVVGVATIVDTKPPEWIRELSGKKLACWCSLDKPCHVDVLAELANAEKGSK